MIDLKVDGATCRLNAGGSRIELTTEIAIAVHSLTEAFAKSTNMSFESAALTIMQVNTVAHKKMNDKE